MINWNLFNFKTVLIIVIFVVVGVGIFNHFSKSMESA